MSGIVKKSDLNTVICKGLDPNDYSEWRRKFKYLRSNAKLRGAVCRLSFAEYLQLAIDAGLTSPGQIGKAPGKYQMGRYTDSGDYRIGSCRFIPMEQNQHERVVNGGSATQAASIRGRTKETHASVAATSKKLSGRTAQTHEYLRISGEKRRGRTKETDESVARMAAKKTGMNASNSEGVRSMVAKRTGRTKHTDSSVLSQSIKKSRSFVAFSPYGVRHVGSNVKEFALAHGLNQSELSKVFRGDVRQHKGWTGHYTD